MAFPGTLLAEFEFKPGQSIKIHRMEYMGSYFFDIRIFLSHGNFPTNKGLRIPVAMLADLLIALNDAISKVRKI